MTIASNMPNGRKYYVDIDGHPLAGGQVSFYVPGTTARRDTFRDPTQSILNTNPIILDAAGSCIAFAIGQFREVVQDAAGNTISDAIVATDLSGSATLSSLGVSDAMLPVVGAPTLAAAEALLAAAGVGPSGNHLQINPADQTIHVAPTANAFDTLASLNVQGIAISNNQREFLVNLGLYSATGATGTAINAGGKDKVTLYTGLVASAGTADVWTLNTCLTMAPNSGSYNAQGFELDFNNSNTTRGASGNLLQDFTAPIANGLSISGFSDFSSTCGLAIEGGSSVSGGVQWNRGIAVIGKMGVCGYQDWATVPVAIQFDGAYSVAALNLTSVHGNAGAITNTALFMKNAQTVSWQNASGAGVISDYVDSGNNRVIGLGSATGTTSGIIMGGITIPLATNTYSLGTSANRWDDAWLGNVRLRNTKVVSWDSNTGTSFVFDYVDNFNNRIVGSGAAICFMGSGVAPISAGHDLGTPANYWGNVYSLNGIAAPSDIRLKKEVKPLPPMLKTVQAIDPIAFKWKDGSDELLHYGFNADHIHDAFPKDFAGYLETDTGEKMLRKDELIATLWKAVQELGDEVAKLKKHVSR